VGLYILAVSGEAIADRQLEVFRSKVMNKGKTLRTGLWRYSRHPNYFFESVHWWAYVPMAVGLPWSWMAVVWPLFMMSALLWITGVPLAEAQAVASRGDDYRNYQRSTSAFIPWVPRKPE
jgi:steroid 5-alpha reductase family enzyme